MSDSSCAQYIQARFPNELIDASRVQKLFRYGMYFVYGMLFDCSFTLTDDLVQTVQQVRKRVDPEAYSVVVHSRHISPEDDGSDIADEISGVDHFFFANNQTLQQKCFLLIMSDRSATTSALYEYAQQRGCEGVALHSPPTLQQQQRRRRLILSQEDEHGPFAGAGYYQDLALVSSSGRIYGIVGSDRSSTALAVERIVYNNVRRMWNGSKTSLEYLALRSGEFCHDAGSSLACRSWLI